MSYPNFRRQYYLFRILFLIGGWMLFTRVAWPAANWIMARGATSDDVASMLKHYVKNSEFVCREGAKGWQYYCDQYPSSGLAKRLVGVNVKAEGELVWTSFPDDIPMSNEELAAFGEATKKFFARVDLNSSSADDFAKLPGVDRALAGRIVLGRSAGRYDSIENLKEVQGLDQATLERIRPLVRIDMEGLPRAEDFVGRTPAN